MNRSIILSSLCCSVFVFSQKNLITNGSFEAGTENWNNASVLSISPYMKKSGQNGAVITEFTTPQWKGVDQNFSIPKNTVALEVSAWMKADGIQQGKNPWNKAVMVTEIDGKNENIGEVSGTTPWTFAKKIIPIDKTRSGRLMIALSECTGSFFFDDVKVIPLKQEDYNKIMEAETAKHQVEVITDTTPVRLIEFTNGDFENGLHGWHGHAETTSEDKVKGAQSLKITSENPVWTGVDQTIDVPQGSKTVEVSAYARTHNLKSGKNAWNKADMIVEFTQDGTSKTGPDQPVFFTDTQEWQQFSKTLEIPEGTRKIRLMIALSEATGIFLVDDVAVKFSR
ncbi:carbohydrate binding domain-containing protein [Weeksellaceae bacterium A-14]